MYTRSFVLVVPMILAGAAIAQPSDRPAAFIQGASTAAALVPVGSTLIEAKLENDDGRWIIQYEYLNGLSSKVEIELDSSTFQQLKLESRPLSSGELSRYTALQATFVQITTTFAQAVGIAAGRTPDGFKMTEIELELQNAAPTYQFSFYNAARDRSRVNVNASTGSPVIPGPGGGGGGGGGTNPAITTQQAIDIALGRYPGANILQVEYDRSDARWEIKLMTGSGSASVSRELKLAADGTLLSDEVRNGSRDEKAEDRIKAKGVPAGSITLAQAAQIALNANAGFTLVSTEWEREGGIVVAKVSLADAVGPKVVFVNPDGSIGTAPVSTPSDDPAPANTFDLTAILAAARTVAPSGVVIEVELEYEAGRWIYKVKLAEASPTRLTQVLIEARTVKVLGSTVLTPGPRYLQKINAVLANRGQITKPFARAQSAALSTLGAGYVKSLELQERQGGGFEYQTKVMVDAKEFELAVDSRTADVKPR